MRHATNKQRKKAPAWQHEQRLQSLTSALLHARARIGRSLQSPASTATRQQLEEIKELVDAVIQATHSITSELSSPILNEPRPRASQCSGLTLREREILELIAESQTNVEIAERLHVSPKTVSTHRQHIMDKLNIHNVVGLTKYAIRNGLTSTE